MRQSKAPLKSAGRYLSAWSWLYVLCIVGAVAATAADPSAAQRFRASGHEGALLFLMPDGQARSSFPLKHTDVALDVSGFLLHARVTQQFENPYKDTIEAVYTFPLPQRAAVHDMTLTVGPCGEG
jgi:hypothetical protein